MTVTQLRQIGAELLNIHGQHDGQQLLDEEQHGAYLDRFGRMEAHLAAYQTGICRHGGFAGADPCTSDG